MAVRCFANSIPVIVIVAVISTACASGQTTTLAVNDSTSMADIAQFQVSATNKVVIDSSGDIIVTGLLTALGTTASFTLPSNSAGFLGPSSTSFTAYALQLPSSGPTSTNPFLSCGTPVSGISPCTFTSPGTVNSGTSDHIAYYASGTNAVSSDTNLDDGATTANTLTYTGSGGITASAGPLTVAGTVSAEGILSTGTTFTAITTCVGGVSTFTGGATAGSFKQGTTGPCATTITMGGSVTAAHGWACSVWDVTTPANIQEQTGYTTTKAIFTGAATSGDIVVFGCVGF